MRDRAVAKTRESRVGARALGRWGATLVLVLVLAAGSLGSGPAVRAQQATPASNGNQNTSRPANPGMGQQNTGNSDPGTGPGAPAILAHGLVYMTGKDVVWAVEEITPPAPSKASSATSQASIMYQRADSSIVRNDMTGKRAQVTTGAAYFIAADDPYTVSGEGNGAKAWNFTLGDAGDVATNAFYESPAITNVSEGTYSMTLTRYVLRADEEASIGSHTGPALVMVVVGQVEVNTGSGPVNLAVSDGQLVENDGSVHNTGASPAVYVVLALGAPVSDDTAGAPQAAEPTPVANNQETPAEASPTEAPVANPTTPPSSGNTSANGEYVTSINITAEASIYLTVTADGLTVFDGTLEPGQSTGSIVGSVFEVYTSIGASTLFTNGCGTSFYMGSESGEAYYTLTADASSCAP